MLDVRRLRLLRELSHRGTLAAVAEALSCSPSAVSQQLALLAVEAGVSLLEPVGRRVRLTPQAEILVAHTEALLERLEQAEADLASSLVDISGTLRVAAFQTAALTLVPPALSSLATLHPALRVEVIEAEPEVSVPGLVARDLDVVLGEEYPGLAQHRRRELEREDLASDALTVALPSDWQDSLTGGLADLADRPWVMEPEGSPARQWSAAVCRTAGFEPDVRFQSNDLEFHARLVETGHAAALLPGLAWNGRAPQAHLASLPGRPARRIFTAARRGAGIHPAVRAFRGAMRRALDSDGSAHSPRLACERLTNR